MQRVDPFIPVRGQYLNAYTRRPYLASRREARSQVSTTAQRPLYGRGPSPQSTIDGFVRASPATHRPKPEPVTPESPWRQSVESTAAAVPKPAKRVKRVLRIARVPFLIAAAISFVLLAQALVVGEVAIALYALFAIVRHITSRTTFLLALASFVVIILSLGLEGGDSTVSDNFAVYAFLLLVVGTVLLGLEARREYA